MPQFRVNPEQFSRAHANVRALPAWKGALILTVATVTLILMIPLIILLVIVGTVAGLVRGLFHKPSTRQTAQPDPQSPFPPPTRSASFAEDPNDDPRRRNVRVIEPH